MPTRKNKLDIDRERHAHDANRRLIGSGVSVAAGGEGGPYTITIERVGKAELDGLLVEILVAAKRTTRPGGLTVAMPDPE